jgi:hypothetical protein
VLYRANSEMPITNNSSSIVSKQAKHEEATNILVLINIFTHYISYILTKHKPMME